MKFVNFVRNDEMATGVATPTGVIDIEQVVDAFDANLPWRYADILNAGTAVISKFRQLLDRVPQHAPYVLDESSLRFGPAALNPQKIICVGLNYSDHVQETDFEQPEQPILFSKFANALAATGDAISTSGLVQIDYEAELALVIGKKSKDVSVEDALDCVFGYANANDLSERELQFRSGQWLIGKTPDGFLPIGPYLVTADEVDDPQDLQIRGWMNGELRQSSNTGNMIFSVAEIISYASRYMTLLPGDVIATGTPPGVILGTQDKIWMKAGDRYDVQIGNLGHLSNRLAPAPPD